MSECYCKQAEQNAILWIAIPCTLLPELGYRRIRRAIDSHQIKAVI